MYKVCFNYCYVIVQCISFCFLSLVPPPLITFAVDPAVDPIYSSTAVNFTCTAVLAEEVDTATMAMATWTGPTGTNGVFGQQPTDPNRISVIPAVSVGERVYESILMFYPVDFEEDNGLHTCQIKISSNVTSMLENNLILPATNINNTIITAIGEGTKNLCIL